MDYTRNIDDDLSRRIAFNPNQRQFMQDDRRYKIKLEQFYKGD